MSSNNSSTLSNPPMFTGENYSVWAIKMKAFLKGNGVWESVEDGFHPPMLPNNPTVDQMKQHVDYVQASYKALSYIHSVVIDDIFSRIMGAETAQEAWDTLKKEFDGSSRVKGNKIVTLKRQFEMLKMQETETVHQYTNKLMDVVNRIRLHGKEFPNRRVVEKIIVSVPDKFESKISAIEESCDLKELTIIELISKLQAHEPRLVMKTDETTERAFLVRQKGKQPATSSESNKTNGSNQAYQQHQQSRKGSGCTNHMARDESLFIEMDKSVITNVKLGNGTVVRSQGKGTVVIQTKTEVDDDSSVLKTKSLAEIYARCNLASAEPNCFEEATMQQLFHMDVKSTFFNGVLQEEIYVEQPPGFEITGKEDCVYKLNKALYGLKQAPRGWYCRIDHYLMSQGFRRSTEEATLYVKGSSSESQLILSLYVDDLLLTENDLKLLEQFKKRKYALDILKKFEMENYKPFATPLVQNEKLSKDDQETKVDSSYYRSLIAKRVLRYIQGTYELGLWFDSNQQGRLQGYADSDWAGSIEDMISITGYVFSFGLGSFSWNSKKQDAVAQSTAEAEYLAAGVAANHAIWLRMVLEELGFDLIEPCVLKVDNMSTIAIAQNPVQHGRTKHIKIKYHVIKNYVQDKEIVLQHCDSEIQVADILTKALPRQKFEEFRDMLGVTNIKSKEEC
ncbi:hypothetical protein SLEP1_g30690 [Rubroshorea leprosula]|uniref:Uncharacterized protein n=1 Tax=Rubroshorea leprosula TaxID=152421 RepID=A0AAV5K9P2_9ROSI|nr:hypothetical protein SLEP1_g30690 [Rubroshorea leprosula]